MRAPAKWPRRWRTSVVALLAPVAVALAGCGGDDGGDGDPPMDSGVIGSCAMAMIISPNLPDTGQPMVLEATIEHDGWLPGLEVYEWRVWRDGVEITDFTPRFEDQRAIEVATAGRAGVFRIELEGEVGEVACLSQSETFNVRVAGANVVSYRLRAVPLAEHQSPVQEQRIDVYGGVDAMVAEWQLSAGESIAGVVQDAAGVGVPAYIRMQADNLPQLEAFAGQDGMFSARVSSTGNYDVLVVPGSPTLAPRWLVQLSPLELQRLDVDEGVLLSGTVLTDSGTPVVGARVSAQIDGVPTTIATTAANGGFSVRGVDGAVLELTAVPPEAMGLPALELPASAGLSAEDGIEVRYAAGVSSRSVSLDVREIDGTSPAVGARVTWIARPSSNAATISVGNDSAAGSGWSRQSAVTGAGGVTPALVLPEMVYDVVVEPAADSIDQSVTLTTIDLRAGQPAPAPMSLQPPARIVGDVRDAAQPMGAPIEGARVSARPLGLLASIPSAAAHDAAGTGRFELSVVAGGTYEIEVAGVGAAFAATRREVQAAGPASELDLGSISLPRAIEIRGSVATANGVGGARGVHLTLLCWACTGQEAERPIAEVVTSASGDFSLPVPDPGVEASAR